MSWSKERSAGACHTIRTSCSYANIGRFLVTRSVKLGVRLLLPKAQLLNRIVGIVCDRKLTQTKAAQLSGLSQPDICRLLKGQFRETSVKRIMKILARLGCEIDIVVKVTGEVSRAQTIHFQAAPV